MDNKTFSFPFDLDGADKIEIEKLKGRGVFIYYTLRGKAFRESGPKKIVFSEKTGKKIFESWGNEEGSTDRKNAPAEICYNDDGEKILERWYENGWEHRTDGPCQIKYDPQTSNIIKEEWIQKNKPFRSDGPYETTYDKKGRLLSERWNAPTTGPSEKLYYPESGIVRREMWTGAKGYHRKDGPAIVERDKTGVVTLEKFYLDGEEIVDPFKQFRGSDNWADSIKKGNKSPKGR